MLLECSNMPCGHNMPGSGGETLLLSIRGSVLRYVPMVIVMDHIRIT